MNRRDFLKMLGGGLLLSATETGCMGMNRPDVEALFESEGVFQPNLFLSIQSDGQIILAMNKSEMGQGIMTASVTLAAEELGVPMSRIQAIQMHKPGFGMQMTGGSTSTATIFKPIRTAAAAAREMLQAAAAQTWRVPFEECAAEDGSIFHASSNRRLSYAELASVAATQPVPKSPVLKPRSEFRVIGSETPRVDGLDKSTGRAIFGSDVQVPNQVAAFVLRSPVMGATAIQIDAETALDSVGVLDVFPFERGVAVVAKKFWQAQRAAQLVKVEWGRGVVEGLNTSDLRDAAMARSQESSDFTLKDVGNVEKAFQQENLQSVSLQYSHPFLSHAPMEPQNCTAMVAADRVKIWIPTQAPTICASLIQQMFDLPLENIEIEITMLGGGFGRRACVDFLLEALQIARLYPDIPVQVQWTREDDMTMGYYRPQGACSMNGAIDDSGQIVAVHSHLVSQLIFPDIGEQFDAMFPRMVPEKMRKKLAYAATGYLSGTSLMGFVEGGDIATCKYSIPNYRYDFTPVRTNIPVTAWRSVAHSYSTFVMETFVDHLAITGQQDPVSLKRSMLQEHPRYIAVLDAVIKESRWGEPIEDGWGRGFAISEFAKSIVAQVVEAGIVNNRIVVRHVTCVVDCGLVVNPDVVRAQMEGGIIFGLSMMNESIDVVDGVVQQRNFDGFPLMRMHETPEIHTVILESDNAPTGIGEIALPPVNAAVSNAIFAATGVRLTHMPLQQDWDAHQTRLTEEKGVAQ